MKVFEIKREKAHKMSLYYRDINRLAKNIINWMRRTANKRLKIRES